jgi:hypothetical protein
MTTFAHRHRRTIYEKLSPIVGDEETEAMLAQFPSTPEQAPVTVNVLDLRLADLRAEMKDLRVAMEHEMRALAWKVVGTFVVGLGLAATVGAMFG